MLLRQGHFTKLLIVHPVIHLTILAINPRLSTLRSITIHFDFVLASHPNLFIVDSNLVRSKDLLVLRPGTSQTLQVFKLFDYLHYYFA